MFVKKLCCIAGIVVCAAATSARADYPCPWQIDAKFNFRFDVRLYPEMQLGPWYTYFPMEAQYPLQMQQHGAARGWGVQVPLTGAGPAFPAPSPTFSYGNYGIPPSYWYGAP